MSDGSMASDWYYVKQGGPGEGIVGRQVGPFTWEQLYLRAEAREFGPDDLVWNPQLPDWFPATRVPGLFPAPAQPVAAAPPEPVAAAQPVAPPDPFAAMEATTVRPAGYQPAAYQPPVYQPPVYQPAPEPRPARRRSWLLPVLIPLITLIVVGGGLGAYFGIWYDGDGPSGGPDGSTASSEITSTTESDAVSIGTADCKVPDLAKLADTSVWGEVPVNQICVLLTEGGSRDDAESLAETLGGSVVGEIEFINAYQIETSGSTEADLTSALEQAKAAPGVESAFANQQTFNDTEIWGVRQSPLNDPAYGDGRGKGFELIGAPKAWTYVRGSGLPLWDVHVGVVDTGLYKGNGECDGDVNFTFPDPDAGTLTSPAKDTNDQNGITVDDPNGSHGTMVAGQIGADPDNGGTTGVASPVLGNHLTISVIDKEAGKYGTAEVQNPDPNDPTVVKWSNGKSYSFGSLVAITKQIESGAKIINCSWSSRPKYESPEWSAAYYKFFEKMSREHPDVLFVCSAGNTQKVKDGANTWPGGRNLPNMVTVGNVKNDGSKWQGSSMMNSTAGHEYEVTLAAPGHEAVQGVDSQGNPITDQTDIGNGNSYGGGTSAAAPQVSAAAAILLSLNPNLTAGEIKDILSRTARPGPAELGGKVLAVDQAVLEVINQQREKQGLPAVTGEDLEKGGVVDAVAISQEDELTWTVKGIIEVLPSVAGAEVTISATSGCEIEGETSQTLATPGEVLWNVHVPGDMAQITVTRKDSNASSVITFEQIDLNGYWAGSLTITDVTVDPDAAPTEGEEGCSLALLAALMDKLKGMAIPLTMDITAGETGEGTALLTIDMAAAIAQLGEQGEGITAENEPQTIPFTLSGRTLTFHPEAAQGATSSMTGTVSQQGDTLVIDGTLSSGGTGFSIKAVWTVTKE